MGRRRKSSGDVPQDPLLFRPAALPLMGGVSVAAEYAGPTLPDGSVYMCGDEKVATELKQLYENITRGFDFQIEHTEFLRIILDLRENQMALYMGAGLARTSSDYKEELAYRDAARKAGVELTKMYSMMDLFRLGDQEKGPYDLWQELMQRVPEFMRRHGRERAYCCPGCGTYFLIYTLSDIEADLDWDRTVAELVQNGIARDEAARVVEVLKKTRVATKWKMVVKPDTHPWLNDPDFPIWSSEVRDMVDETCECGRPKLTFEDAARILRISPAAVDQLLQEDRRRSGLAPVPAMEKTGASLFQREGETRPHGDTEIVIDVFDERGNIDA